MEAHIEIDTHWRVGGWCPFTRLDFVCFAPAASFTHDQSQNYLMDAWESLHSFAVEEAVAEIKPEHWIWMVY